MPGVPDVYQGTELWDYSLVDPDNRRPVDFAARRELLARIDDGWLPPVDEIGRREAAGHQPDAAAAPAAAGAVHRRTGRCSPTGRVGEHVLAFDRGGAVAVATRLPVGLARHGGWGDTTLSLDGHTWTEVFTEHQLRRQSSRGRRPAAHVPRRAAGEGTMTIFEVWAPEKTVRLRIGRSGPRDGARRRRLVAARRAGRRPRHRLRLRAAGRRHGRCPTRARAGSLTACTGPAGSTTTSPSTGPTAPGPAASCPAASSTSCTSARSPPEGTFDAAIERLDHLVDLGVDLVELLPVNAFNGEHNWGYDGVCWFAPHEAYGGPDGLKRFVDAAHGKGLGVVLDVVYNHFGPTGAYAPMFAPYLSAAGSNPWGASVNLDGPHSDEVRRYIIDSALAWLRDYHVDGLRLDAVHALRRPQRGHTCSRRWRSRWSASPPTWAGRCR